MESHSWRSGVKWGERVDGAVVDVDYVWAEGTAQGAEGVEESGDIVFVGGVAAGGAPERSFDGALLAVDYDKGCVRVVGHIYGSLTTIWTVVFGLLE